jgi:glycine/D-amino acid oxidase-like deaminating enzyme
MHLPKVTDIVIVGAGISGLSVALPAAKAGCSVVVLDKGEPWSDASGANAGTLSIQVKRSEVLSLIHESVQRWQRMPEDYGIDVGFGQPGGIRVATTDAEVIQLEQSVQDQQNGGIDVQMLDYKTLRTMAPWLGPQVKAGSFCGWDSYSNPLHAGNAMVAGARAMGVVVAGGNAVTSIDHDKHSKSGRYRVVTSTGQTIRASHIVNTAGAWAGEIAAMLGARLPMEIDVNMLTVTESAPPLFDRVVTHVGGILSIKQFANGTCLIGGGWQGRGSVKSGIKQIDYERFIHNMRVAARVVPTLANLHIVRTWAGFEAVAPDALPIIGALGGYDRAWVLACARGGYSLAPALGAKLAEMILSPSTCEPWPQFSPKRFCHE